MDILRLGIVPGKGVQEMGKTRPPYPAEFKEEAVRLARSSGKPAAQIARELGVSYESLRHKVRSAFP